MRIEPPTTNLTANTSNISSSVTPSSVHLITWYVMQSSQRRTSDATGPSIPFVFAPSAPASYARLSSAKNRLIVRLFLPAIRSFSPARKA